MKAILFGASLALSATVAVAQTPVGQIERDAVTPGYAALMSNNNEEALRQLLADRTASRDPAQLLNIGRAYARLGDKANARKAFKAAAKSTQEYDLVLADGSVMNSRKAALLALKTLD